MGPRVLNCLAREWQAILLSLILVVPGGLFFDAPFMRSALAGMLVLIVAAAFRNTHRVELIGLAVFLPAALAFTACANQALVLVTPHTVDGKMLRLDHGVSTAVWRWTDAHSFAHYTLWVVYSSLPLFMAIVLALAERPLRAAGQLLLATCISPFGYLAFPAVGPIHVGDPAAPRNCFPSMHLAWALVLCLHTRGRFCIFAIAFTALTGAATLGLGEHYVIGLCAAVVLCALTVFQYYVWKAHGGARATDFCGRRSSFGDSGTILENAPSARASTCNGAEVSRLDCGMSTTGRPPLLLPDWKIRSTDQANS